MGGKVRHGALSYFVMGGRQAVELHDDRKSCDGGEDGERREEDVGVDDENGVCRNNGKGSAGRVR